MPIPSLTSDHALDVLSVITQGLQQGRPLSTMLEATVVSIRAALEIDQVLIVQDFTDGRRSLVATSGPVGYQGMSRQDLSSISTSCQEPTPPPSPDQRQIPIAQPEATLELSVSKLSASATLETPITYQDQSWGMLICRHDRSARSWHPSEVQYLQQIASHLGIATHLAPNLHRNPASLPPTHGLNPVPTPSFLQTALASPLPAISPDQLLRTLWEQAPLGVVYLSETLDIQYCNPTFLDQVGYTFPELQTLGFRQIIHPNDVSSDQRLWQQLLQGERSSYTQERRYRHKSGRVIWAMTTVAAIPETSAYSQGYYALVCDITERKHQELCLQASQATLTDILSSPNVAISSIRITPDGRWQFDYRSTGYEFVFGYTAQELEADPDLWLSRVDSDDRDRIIITSLVAQAMATSHGCNNREYRFFHKDGSLRWIAATYTYRWNQDAQCTVLTIIETDITTFKQAETTLRQSEAKNQAIIAAIPDLMFTVGADGIYREYITHRRSQDLLSSDIDPIGKSMTDILTPELAQRQHDYMQRALETGTLQMYEQQLQIADRWQDEEVRVIRSGEDEVLFMIRDVTDRKQAEAALKHSEEQRRLAIDLNNIGCWEFDLVTQQAHWNDNHFQLIGLEPGMVTASYLTWQDRVHPDDRPWIEQTINQALETKANLDVEYRVVHPDHTLRWVLTKGQGIYDADGQAVRMVGVTMDITDRKVVELALQDSQRQYQTLVENSPDIIERFDPQLRHLYVSPSLTAITGVPAHAFLGKTCRELGFSELMITTWEAAIEQLYATGQKQLIEFETPTLSGMRSFEMAIVPELDHADTIQSILCLSRDITDRKQTEAALRESQHFIQKITENTPNLLYIYDLIQQRNVYANRSMAEMLGYSTAAIQHMGSDLLPSLCHPNDLGLVYQTFQRCATLADGDYVEVEYRLQDAEHNWHWIYSRDVVFTRTADGRVQQILGTSQDITQQKLAEQTLQQQAKHDQLIAEVTSRIRQSLNLDQILTATVTEVRQVLMVDRALIVQIQADGFGQIVAESMLPTDGLQSPLPWPQDCIITSQSQDLPPGIPSLISSANIDELMACLSDMMETMGIQSHLAVPIVQVGEGRTGQEPQPIVWGVLVAHVYKEARPWQPTEYDLLQRIADKLAIAIQQSELYHQVQTLNTSLENQVQERTAQLQQALGFEALLKRITDKVRDSLDERQILQTAVVELAQGLAIDACDTGIYNLEQATSTIAYEFTNSLTSAQGFTFEFAKSAHPEVYPHLLCGQVCHFSDVSPSPLRFDQPLKTTLAVPIVDDQGALGDLWLFKPADDVFNDQEVRLAQQVANQCAIALRQSRLYQAVQHQVEELERLSHLKDDFLNTVSHELRTPMSNIKMATQMLEIGLTTLGIFDQDPTISRYFKILQEEGHREISLINDLLDMARLDADTEPLTLMTISLQYFLPHLAEPFIERTANQQQRLEISIPDDLPDVTTDLAYLERILTELLHNACKYTPSNETITLSAQNASTGLTISVSNTGVDLSAAECDRIFEKFYRIPSKDPWKHGGTGLGLALVKKLAGKLNATLELVSHPGFVSFVLNMGT